MGVDGRVGVYTETGERLTRGALGTIRVCDLNLDFLSFGHCYLVPS